MKRRVIYSLIIENIYGRTKEDVLKLSELHKLAKILKDNERVLIRREKVSIQQYNYIFGINNKAT